jgi:hypothetical protein
MGISVPTGVIVLGLWIVIIIILAVYQIVLGLFVFYWLEVSMLVAVILYSNVNLGTFYRSESAPARGVQHRAALALSIILLSNPVAVSVQYATAVQPDGPDGDTDPFIWWIFLQGAYFVFLFIYTSACIEIQDTGNHPACSTFCCSTRDWIVLSVVFAAFVQIISLIVVTTEYSDGNPLFPVWLVVFQTGWTAWAGVYDWILHLAECSCCRCGENHWSVALNDRGRLAPDTDLSVQLL